MLSKLGVPTELGTDTAWTFEPHPPEFGRKALAAAGWDGRTPVLAVCPINPFWWPVKPSVAKFWSHGMFGAYKQSHYSSVYFHNSGSAVDAAYQEISGIDRWRRESVPREARRVSDSGGHGTAGHARVRGAGAAELGGAPVFTSDAHDMYELVSVLRCCSMMVSSRYHAMVTSMPGLVPSAGITMDERIRNLLRERGHEHLLMTVDDPDLEAKLLVVLERLATEADAVRDGIGAFGGAQSEDHGAHGSVSGTRGAHVLSGVSGALGSARVGRVSSAAQPESAAAVGNV